MLEDQEYATVVPVIAKVPTFTCWAHNQTKHDFFLSYRVASERKKSLQSSKVGLGSSTPPPPLINNKLTFLIGA